MAHMKVDLESNLVDVDASNTELVTCIDMVLESYKKHSSKIDFMLFKYSVVHSILYNFFTDEDVIDCMKAYEGLKAHMEGIYGRKTDEK